MAWPEQKSALRRRLNIRWLRWAFWRFILQWLPLARSLSFPVKSVAALSASNRQIENLSRISTTGFSSDEIAFIKRAQKNDKRLEASGSIEPVIFRRQTAVIPHCAVLGHVGAAIKSDSGALLSFNGQEIPNWNRSKPRRLKRKRFDHGLVTWLEGTKHYFHFFASLLPLIDYLERQQRAGHPLTVLIPSDGPAFQDRVCAAIAEAYTGLQFVTLAPNERAEIQNYLWLYHSSTNAEWLPVNRSLARTLSTILRQNYRLPEPRGGELMFFSRGDAKQRRLLNEAELEDIAVNYGFDRFEANSGNHREQLKRFGEADVIVAVHGAGLTNLLFARPGATVIEIFPEDCVKSTYLWLARRLGLNYRALVGGPGDYRQAFHCPANLFARELENRLRSPHNDFLPFPSLSAKEPAFGKTKHVNR